MIHEGLIFFFTVKVGMHISAAASNKSLTLSVQVFTSSSKKVQFHGMYFNNSFISVKFALLKFFLETDLRGRPDNSLILKLTGK